MLALVSIFVATLLISAVSIWLYRTASGWQGSNSVVVARRGKTRGAKLRPQQGFVSLKGLISQITLARTKVKFVRLKSSAASLKAPWGW